MSVDSRSQPQQAIWTEQTCLQIRDIVQTPMRVQERNVQIMHIVRTAMANVAHNKVLKMLLTVAKTFPSRCVQRSSLF